MSSQEWEQGRRAPSGAAFLLRSVDQQDLIAKADTGLRPTKKGAAAAKVLDAGNLSEIFGIEMPEGASEPNLAVRRKRAVGTSSTRVRSRRGGENSVAPAAVGASGKGPAAAAGKSIASKPIKPTAASTNPFMTAAPRRSRN